MRRLIVNADDFGFTRDVNAGIVEAHREGILTATTLMAVGAAFDDAVRLARDNPTLDVGCHLVLTGAPGLPATVMALIRALALGRIDPYAALRAQIEKTIGAGIRPTHLDTHKHTHLHPAVLSAVARLSEEFGIRWVRRPFDLPLNGQPVPWPRRLVARGLSVVKGRFQRTLERHGCRTTDRFAGFAMTGTFSASDLVRLIENLPEGTTEFMCHPGLCTAELRAEKTRLKESREMELRALTDPSVRAALSRSGVVLANYSGT